MGQGLSPSVLTKRVTAHADACPIYEEIRLIDRVLLLLLSLPSFFHLSFFFSAYATLGIPRGSRPSLSSSYVKASRDLLGIPSHQVPISVSRIFRIVRVSGSTFLCLV
ncbi:hypothetical protein LX36DRAFT_351411 [Colletotrichum falcatum]|nr:hypothetical protein LX36DRAFT_351411 [Colletotrichum falcatum]